MGADQGKTGLSVFRPRPEDSDLHGRMETRTRAAFGDEERVGLLLATKVRTAALSVLFVWQVFWSNADGLAKLYVLGVILTLLFLGLAHLLFIWLRRAPGWLNHMFAALDCAFVGFVLVTPNPFVDADVDVQSIVNSGNFTIFFLFLMQSTFSYRPQLVLWSGLCIVATWSVVLAYVLGLPGVYSEIGRNLSIQQLVQAYRDPGFVFVGEWVLQVIVTVLVTGGLALVVHRAREVAMARGTIERARANLARYFPPKVVDLLEDRDRPFQTIRRQNVAVLFADIRGFTAMAEAMPPEQVMELLRRFHAVMEGRVFAHGGTLEKYIGDAMLASFGVPERGPEDATNALACGYSMLRAMAEWNRERGRRGQVPLAVGIGLNYGPAVQGDIGTGRSMSFAVIGDTVNTTSRLQGLARDLMRPLIASETLVERVRTELGPGGNIMLDPLEPLGDHTLRGRARPIAVWGLPAAEISTAGKVEPLRRPAQ